MTIKQQVTRKMNEGQESDAHKYSWNTIPHSLKVFWLNYFRNLKNQKL